MIDEDGPEDNQLGPPQSFNGNLPSPLEDVFEKSIEGLYGPGADKMKNAAHRCSWIRMRIGTPPGGDQNPSVPLALPVELRVIVGGVPQDEPDLTGQLGNEGGSYEVIGRVGGGKPCGQRNPDACRRTGNVELPSVPPTMIAGLGPVGFGVDSGVWNDPLLAVLLMPHPSLGSKRSRVHGQAARVEPGADEVHKVASKRTDQEMASSPAGPLGAAPRSFERETVPPA